MSKEIANDGNFSVGDIIRLPKQNKQGEILGYRVWEIAAIITGGTGQENHVELRPLDRNLGHSVESLNQHSLVPEDMLRSTLIYGGGVRTKCPECNKKK